MRYARDLGAASLVALMPASIHAAGSDTRESCSRPVAYAVMQASSTVRGRRELQMKHFHWLTVVLAPVLMLFATHPLVAGQFMEGTDQFRVALQSGQDALRLVTYSHPDLVDIYYPELNLIPIDDFRYEEPRVTSVVFGAGSDYLMNVVFDPCRGKNPDCCEKKYGTPEYLLLENTTSQIPLDQTGVPFNTESSRIQDRKLVIDEVCTGPEKPFRVMDSCLGCLQPPDAFFDDSGVVSLLVNCPDAIKKHCAVNTGIYSNFEIDVDFITATDMYTNELNRQPREFQILCRRMTPTITTCRRITIWKRECFAERTALVQTTERPDCWDYNETVPADNPCYDISGNRHENCIQLAYMQNAFLYQCSGFQGSGPYSTDLHCGTYLELHLPNITYKYSKEQVEVVINEVKLPEGIHDGYRTIVLPMYYQSNPQRLLCEGVYQLWWVQRTLYDFVIQKRRTFRVTSPACDWDPYNKLYLPYKDLGNV